jgi:hypothetical protein
MIPELAVRNSSDENYHVGVGPHIPLSWASILSLTESQRGGQGNVHLDEATLKEKEKKKHTAHEGLADKLKNKLLGRK